jgi:hypothetical protein
MSIWDRLRIEAGRAKWFWGEAVASAQFAALRLQHGEAPIPLDRWRRAESLIRSVATRDEPLVRAGTSVEAHTVALPEPLAALFGATPLGEWTLDADTIRWLWGRGMRERPARIIECGGGVSTLLCTALLRELHGVPAAAHLVTLEQEPDHAAAVRARITAAGLAEWVTVVDAPIGADGNYTFDPAAVRRALGGDADWLLVDGPRESRDLTIPSLAACCRRDATWFLDDALGRDYFAATERWSRWPGVRVEGIVAVGKGLAVGSVTDPAAAVAAISAR